MVARIAAITPIFNEVVKMVLVQNIFFHLSYYVSFLKVYSQ